MKPTKTIPANLEAEQAVLGSLLIDPDAIIKIGAVLTASDFYAEKHGWVYEAILRLHEAREPSDLMLVVDALERAERLQQLGGLAYLTSLVNVVPTAVHVEYYAEIVRRAALLRRVIAIAGQMASLAYQEDADAQEVVEAAEAMILSLSDHQQERDVVSLAQAVGPAMDQIAKIYEAREQGVMLGVPTGYQRLDKVLQGFQKSDLITLAARPSIGKTSLALGFGWHAAHRYGKRVLFMSQEMSRNQLISRLLASYTGIQQQRIRAGELSQDDWALLAEGAGVLAEAPFFIDDTPVLSVLDIRSKARRMQAERGLDMVIVDYLQLMRDSGRNENRQQQISAISRGMKALARELDVPVIQLSQLSRAVEQRSDHKPMLSDLRESGSLDQDSDVVMFLYAEDHYKENTDRKNVVDVIVAKHRNGATDSVPLYFDRALTRFADLEMARMPLS